MKSQLSWQTDQNLESSARPQHHPQYQPSLWSKFNDTWQMVIAYFSTSSEPYVWQSQDQTGLPQWKAYDPMTRRSAEYNSEAEMRVWLEERHYQYHRLAR